METGNPQNPIADPPSEKAGASDPKGYRLDTKLLRPEDIAYFEGLAAAHGHTLPEFIARVVVLTDTEKVVECIHCQRIQRQVGVYPAIPWRPYDDPYETKLAIRLLGNRWVEITEPGKREAKYVCSVCVTTNVMAIKLFVKMIAKAWPGAIPDEGFIDDIFGAAVPTHRALASGQRQLGAPKKK